MDPEGYNERNRVERFFSKSKQFRRVATRYEKLKVTSQGLPRQVFGFIRPALLRRKGEDSRQLDGYATLLDRSQFSNGGSVQQVRCGDAIVVLLAIAPENS